MAAALVVAAVVAIVTVRHRGHGEPRPPVGAVVVDRGSLAVEQAHGPQRVDLTGINSYELTSAWGVNAGCGYGGWTAATLDSFFSSLRPGSLVRTWFFQSMATNAGRRDWRALDRVVATAARYHDRLVAVLGNQNGQCDDGEWKDAGWYRSGYRQPVTGYPTSYATWANQVVARYGPSGAVAVWEPVNEPNPVSCGPGQNCYSSGGCPSQAAASAALSSFFSTVGGLIHRLDRWSLVADGSLGTGDCGTATDAAYRRVISTPGIDLTDYHDYSPTGTTVPSDLDRRVRDAQRLGKAAMIGEAGVSGCASGQLRAQVFQRKISGAFRTGVSAYLPWYYGGDQGNPDCNAPIDVDSPTWSLLHRTTWTPPAPPPGTPIHEVGADTPS